MTDANGDGDHGWDRGWNEHNVRQLVRLARLPFAEKLDWLEEAHRLAEAIRPSKRKLRTTFEPRRPSTTIAEQRS